MKEINQTIWVLTLVVIFTGCRRGSDPLEPSTAPASNLDSLIVTSRKSLTSVEDMGLIQTNEGSRSAIFRPNQAKIPAAFTNYNADGSVRYSIVPEAEENGQVRSAKAYDAAGRMKWQETYAYDQSGKPGENRTESGGWEKDSHPALV